MVLYFCIVFVVYITQLARKSLFQTKAFANCLIIVMFMFMSIVILLNPFTLDMERYLIVFQEINEFNLLQALSYVRWEPGFVIYQWLLSKVTTSPITFVLVSMVLMWGILISALKKSISPKDVPLVMLGYISLFCFYNLSRNIVRQGLATPLLLHTILYLEKSNYKKAILYLLLAVSFHKSAIVGLILFILNKLKLSIKVTFGFFILSSILMIIGLNKEIMMRLIPIIGGSYEASIINYSSENIISRYGSINRIDFLLFTTIWLILGILFKNKYLKDDRFYKWLLISYMGLSIVYVLFGFIGYSDRLAVYAWYLIPIVLFYPVINMKSKYRFFWITTNIVITIGLLFFFEIPLLYRPISLLY